MRTVWILEQAYPGMEYQPYLVFASKQSVVDYLGHHITINDSDVIMGNTTGAVSYRATPWPIQQDDN